MGIRRNKTFGIGRRLRRFLVVSLVKSDYFILITFYNGGWPTADLYSGAN